MPILARGTRHLDLDMLAQLFTIDYRVAGGGNGVIAEWKTMPMFEAFFSMIQ